MSLGWTLKKTAALIYSEHDGQHTHGKKPLKKPLLRKRERNKPKLIDTPTTLFIVRDFAVFLGFDEVLV